MPGTVVEYSLVSLFGDLVMPLGVHTLGTLLAILLFMIGRRTLAAVTAIVSSAILLILATGAAAGWITTDLETRHPPAAVADLPIADAIAVLGGGLNAGPSPERINLNAAGDRVLHAARLFHAGRAEIVVALGGVAHPTSGRSDGAAMAELLFQLGVPIERIVIDEGSTTTRQNCVNLREIAAERGLGRILLVTSAVHMPRAIGSCRAVGLDCVPASTDVIADEQGRRTTGLGGWVPTGSALRRTSQGLWEHLGLTYYRSRRWIQDRGVGVTEDPESD